MRILLVKDGTVPVTVAEVLSIDGDPGELAERTQDGDLALEYYDIEDGAEALYVTWEETMGMEVAGCTFAEGLKLLSGDFTGPDDERNPAGEQLDTNGISEVEPGHLVTTVHPGDREWYIHVIDIRGRR